MHEAEIHAEPVVQSQAGLAHVPHLPDRGELSVRRARSNDERRQTLVLDASPPHQQSLAHGRGAEGEDKDAEGAAVLAKRKQRRRCLRGSAARLPLRPSSRGKQEATRKAARNLNLRARQQKGRAAQCGPHWSA